MAKVHVLLKKEELDVGRLRGKVVIVLDVLFATTSIVTALAHGAKEVVPALDGEACLAEAQRRPNDSYILSGELHAATLPGFCDPTPMSLMSQNLAGRSVLYSTTNGTVALTKSKEADHVYAASLLNGEAVVKHILNRHPENTVLIVCSGSADNFNLEDFYGAGYLVSLFGRWGGGEQQFSDTALAAEMLHERDDALACLTRARAGRMMLARNLEEEVRFAARKNCYAVVPKFRDDSLRAI